MLSRRITILRVAGIPIRLDASWIVIALVVTWSLAVNFASKYPLSMNPELTLRGYFVMGSIGALSLFVCLVLHELGHSLVAQRFGMRIRSITLFIFGGVAELESEPRSAKAEFWMAIAGPAVSVVLAASFWFTWAFGGAAGWPTPVCAVLRELAVINAILVVFNLVPAFPLDGGRVARAMMWAITGDLKRATRVTSQMGDSFGTVMMLVGVMGVLTGLTVFGLWWMLLGWFLRGAAQSSYKQAIARDAFEGARVGRFMTKNVSSIPSDLSIDQLVDRYVYQEHHKLYPVRDNGHVLGYVTPREIKKLAREEWPSHRVSEIMAGDLDRIEISPESDAMSALSRMQNADQSRLLVVDHGELVGILTLKDLLDFLSLRMELEEV